MANKNINLQNAKSSKDDEFYTRYEDIENEVMHYKISFANKTVLCNCDDPFESNFCKFFLKNFNVLKLKRLICTSFASSKVIATELKTLNKNDRVYNHYYDSLNRLAKITEGRDIYNYYYDLASRLSKYEILKHEVSVRPYAVELIELLRELGMILILATTTTRRNLATYCNENPDTQRLDLENNFSLILSMEDVTCFKPNPEIFNKAVEIMHIDRENAIIIEDSIVGIKAANAAGIASIAVAEKHSSESTDELKKCANVYIDSLEVIYEVLSKNLIKKAKKTEK